MFGRKKEAAPDSAEALALIHEALADLERASGGAFLNPYISGLCDMAFTLGAITQNERAEFTSRAHELEQELKAKAQPVYKKKGVYEYNGYYILKDLAKAAGDGSACWCIRKIDGDEILAKDLTFKAAAKEIDKL